MKDKNFFTQICFQRYSLKIPASGVTERSGVRGWGGRQVYDMTIKGTMKDPGGDGNVLILTGPVS